MLEYQFNQPALYQLALTHRSASRKNNERLEFLGDAILSVIVSDMLYHQYPTAREGELTRLRSMVVREETLADLARDIELNNKLKLGAGEIRTGGAQRPSILADAFEALIGAVFLDGGITACQNTFKDLLQSKLDSITNNSLTKDPKTELQECLQGQGLDLPVYTLVDTAGLDHAKTFYARCEIPELKLEAIGIDHSRRAAETKAAAQILEKMRNTSA